MCASTKREVRLIETDNGEWDAVDEQIGTTGTGATREAALSALDAERSDPVDDVPSDDRLHGMAGGLDVDPVESVREVRETESVDVVAWQAHAVDPRDERD